MSKRHLAHWPRLLPQHLTLPATHLYRNLEVSAMRYLDKAALVFYDVTSAMRACRTRAKPGGPPAAARCGVRRGDLGAAVHANSLQFVIGYYAILRADA